MRWETLLRFSSVLRWCVSFLDEPYLLLGVFLYWMGFDYTIL